MMNQRDFEMRRHDVIVVSSEKVRRAERNWGDFAASGLINDRERELLQQIESQPLDVVLEAVNRDADAYAQLFGTMLARINQVEVLKYVILTVSDIIHPPASVLRDMLVGSSDNTLLGGDDHDNDNDNNNGSSNNDDSNKDDGGDNGDGSAGKKPRRAKLSAMATYVPPLLVRFREGSFFNGERGEATLLRLCDHEDFFVRCMALDVASAVLSSEVPPRDAADRFIFQAAEVLRSSAHTHPVAAYTCAARALQTMLRVPRHRSVFAAAGMDNVAALGSLVKQNAQSPQLLYHLLYAAWLLSFDETVVTKLGEYLIPPVVSMLRKVTKEKVVRVSLALLRNLLDQGSNNQDMIILGLMKTLTSLSGKRWDDEDIVENIDTLKETLSKDAHELTSFETYRKEVISGELEWSPVHKSRTFWREHIAKFEANEFQLLRYLVNLLIESHDPKTLAIACHDLGEFVLNHSAGKEIATELKIKTKVMSFLQHEDAVVRKESLLAVQKMLVSNWELLS